VTTVIKCNFSYSYHYN